MRISGTLVVILSLLLALMAFSGCDTPGTGEPEPEEPNDPPPMPTLVYTGDNATGQSVTPIFIWECTDPDGDDLNFTHVIYNEDDPLNTTYETQTDQHSIEWSGDDLSEDTEYVWFVTADDRENDPVSCNVDTFTTGTSVNNPPSRPSNLHPSHEETAVDADDLTLSWDECMDPDGDPIVYDVRFNDGFGLSLVRPGKGFPGCGFAGSQAGAPEKTNLTQRRGGAEDGKAKNNDHGRGFSLWPCSYLFLPVLRASAPPRPVFFPYLPCME